MEGNKELLRVGITIGDINGIGPEVILKSLKDNRILSDFTPVIYGSSKVISFYKRQLNIQDFNYISCKTADEIQKSELNQSHWKSKLNSQAEGKKNEWIKARGDTRLKI